MSEKHKPRFPQPSSSLAEGGELSFQTGRQGTMIATNPANQSPFHAEIARRSSDQWNCKQPTLFLRNGSKVQGLS